ncbi:MAG: SH3 domain-containing protein [Hyphomicrobiales bacterium]
MTNIFKTPLKAAYILALGTSVFSGGTTTATAASIEVYVCDAIGDGHYEVSITSDRSTKARVSYVIHGGKNRLRGPFNYYKRAGQRWVAGNGFDFAYANGRGNFHDKNANAFADCRSGAYNGGRQTYNPPKNNTRPNTTAASPVHLNIRALSLGGSLRTGPGIQFQKIGSIYGRKRVRLLNNTGVQMNGYNWFEIVTPDGRRAFQWGGIMCSPRQYVQGIYERCN